METVVAGIILAVMFLFVFAATAAGIIIMLAFIGFLLALPVAAYQALTKKV